MGNIERAKELYIDLKKRLEANKDKVYELVDDPFVSKYLELIDEKENLSLKLKIAKYQNELESSRYYEKLLSENGIMMSELRKKAKVSKYIKLMKEQEVLDYKFKKAKFDYEKNKYLNCDHLFVRYGNGDNNKPVCHCLKCGFDTKLKSSDRFVMDSDDYQRYRIMKDNNLRGMIIGGYTNLELAKKIYQGIIKKHPDISNEIATKYFMVAKYFILKKGKENYNKHAKHLGLKK